MKTNILYLGLCLSTVLVPAKSEAIGLAQLLQGIVSMYNQNSNNGNGNGRGNGNAAGNGNGNGNGNQNIYQGYTNTQNSQVNEPSPGAVAAAAAGSPVVLNQDPGVNKRIGRCPSSQVGNLMFPNYRNQVPAEARAERFLASVSEGADNTEKSIACSSAISEQPLSVDNSFRYTILGELQFSCRSGTWMLHNSSCRAEAVVVPAVAAAKRLPAPGQPIAGQPVAEAPAANCINAYAGTCNPPSCNFVSGCAPEFFRGDGE